MLWKCKNLLIQSNCTYTYKYLKEKTKTAQPKPSTAVCEGEKKKGLMNNVVKVL